MLLSSSGSFLRFFFFRNLFPLVFNILTKIRLQRLKTIVSRISAHFLLLGNSRKKQTNSSGKYYLKEKRKKSLSSVETVTASTTNKQTNKQKHKQTNKQKTNKQINSLSSIGIVTVGHHFGSLTPHTAAVVFLPEQHTLTYFDIPP